MKPLILLSCLLFLSYTGFSGSVDTVKVFSNAMNRSISSVIIQPALKEKGRIFPVLYLLHGFGGNFALWINKVPELQQLADKYRCIIVCPDAGRATLYFDNPLDSSSKFETYFIKELIPFVEKHYNVSRERKFRAICGLSMGGFGAFYLASRYTDMFYSAGSMSGMLDLGPFAKNAALNKRIPDSTCCTINWEKFKPLADTDSLEKLSTQLIMDCGLEDYLLPVNRHVHKMMMDLKIPHDYTERPGRHEWDYWKNAIEYQLLFFRKIWDRP
jgi:S-formylglutathione hydrolase FrmB